MSHVFRLIIAIGCLKIVKFIFTQLEFFGLEALPVWAKGLMMKRSMSGMNDPISLIFAHFAVNKILRMWIRGLGPKCQEGEV